MVKRYYFSRSGMTRQYCLDDGSFGSRRRILGKDGDFILDYLKKNIDKKRRSEFYLLKENLSREEIKSIRKFFSDSKVKVNLESRLSL